jgi:phosphoenolpyruvate carboxylase
MPLNETYTTDTRLNTLKKSIPTWITSLQGTGNMELNQVVNQLHQLNHQVSRPTDSSGIQQEVTNLYRQVQVIKTRHQEPYRTRLNEVEAALAKLRA